MPNHFPEHYRPKEKILRRVFLCNRGDTMHYWMWTNYDALLHSSMSMTDNTTQCHVGHSIKGITPSSMPLVFLTPRQALSSHPRQQMVWLYWLQDRDNMPNQYTISHSTTLNCSEEWYCTFFGRFEFNWKFSVIKSPLRRRGPSPSHHSGLQ